MNEITDTQAAYIAGIIDGEGCVTFAKSFNTKTQKRPTFKALVLCVNTDHGVIDYLHQTLGCGITYKPKKNPTNPRWNPLLRYQASSGDARDILRRIRPYMIIKGEIADTVLSLPQRNRTYWGKPGTQRYADGMAVYEEQLAIVARVRAMNKRGVKDAA